MKNLALLFLMFSSLLCNGQSFNWPLKDEVKVPRPVVLQLTAYLEKEEDYPVMPEKFTHLPTFNVLHPSQRTFVDGIYFFYYNAHDTGRLFINRKGKVTVLKGGSILGILANYSTYLKQNPLPEITQIEYLSAISAFLKHQYKSRKELVESGALLELK